MYESIIILFGIFLLIILTLIAKRKKWSKCGRISVIWLLAKLVDSLLLPINLVNSSSFRLISIILFVITGVLIIFISLGHINDWYKEELLINRIIMLVLILAIAIMLVLFLMGIWIFVEIIVYAMISSGF